METKKCTTLEEARDAIDQLDEEIVKLIAQRNNYIRQIAHFKSSIDEIKAEERIN
ncbi:MAG: chorismate mutase, partial [Sulfurovum sp.]|nr:chorismate mutase [Sulfurovum sp.]